MLVGVAGHEVDFKEIDLKGQTCTEKEGPATKQFPVKQRCSKMRERTVDIGV